MWTPSHSQFTKLQRYLDVPCDVALPCATQNEIDGASAERMVRKTAASPWPRAPTCPARLPPSRCTRKPASCSPPPRPPTPAAWPLSGLEMCQNYALFLDIRGGGRACTQKIMEGIFHAMLRCLKEYGVPGDLVAGANIAGFLKVADSMLAQGVAY